MPVSTHGRVGIKHSKHTNGGLNNSDVGYEFLRKVNNDWESGTISVSNLCAEEQTPKVLILFLPDVADFVKLQVHNEIGVKFNIPAIFWSPEAREANGYCKCEDTRDTTGDLTNFNLHLRFLIKEPVKTVSNIRNGYFSNPSYVWHRPGLFVNWTSTNNMVALCFGLPPALKQLMSGVSQLSVDSPFSFPMVLIEKIIALFDTALWSWRDVIRDLEQNRASQANPQPDYVEMHEIARHTIHSSETLAMAIETMTSLIQEHQIFCEENRLESTAESRSTKRTFRSQLTFFKCLHLRSKALEERLRNEINLAFNTVAQHDSRIAVQISKATHVDSVAMKTVSVLGLIFLPGTFICALFSMSFFHFSPATKTEPQQWLVSEKFWIYWVVAIPVTVITLACWASWQRIYHKSRLY